MSKNDPNNKEINSRWVEIKTQIKVYCGKVTWQGCMRSQYKSIRLYGVELVVGDNRKTRIKNKTYRNVDIAWNMDFQKKFIRQLVRIPEIISGERRPNRVGRKCGMLKDS